MDEVPKRPYNAPRRREQAQQTRRKILEAARRLFSSRGYAATTLPAIAREAGVSSPTVTAVFGTKPALLDALIAMVVRGDAGSAPLADRTWWLEMLQEPDPHRALRLLAANGRRIQERSADLAEIVRGAATADPEIATVMRRLGERRLQDIRQVVDSLFVSGELKEGLEPQEATDLLWALSSSEMYRLLVSERGWPAKRYEEWLASLAIHSLLAEEKESDVSNNGDMEAL